MVYANKARTFVTMIAYLFIVIPTAQAEQSTIITGQNNSVVDIPAVQSALDRGGTVLLKGTFDFGSDTSLCTLTDSNHYNH